MSLTLEQLVAQFRIDSQDAATPPLTSDAEVAAFLNEGEEEAAGRANLIFDSSTAAVVQVAVLAGTSTYPLHAAVFHMTRAQFTPTASPTEPAVLVLTDRLEQDRRRPGWRVLTDEPRELIVDDSTMQLGCIPVAAGLLELEVYRAPLSAEVMVLAATPADTPTIGRAHQRHLVQWALYRHFSKPDAEIRDPGRAQTALATFTAQFGIRLDADMRRSFQANQPHFNKAMW